MEKKGAHTIMIQQIGSETREEEQEAKREENVQQQWASACPAEPAFRPLTRLEQRNLWIKAYGEQDVALHMWARLVEEQDLEIEMLLQMHGLLVFGVLVSTLRYAQFYIDMNEELHREHEPETVDTLRGYYLALVPPRDKPEIGQEGLPVISRYIHLRDVTIMSAGHKVKLPF